MTATSPCALKAYDYDYSHREKSSSLEMANRKKKGKERAKTTASRTIQTSEVSDVESAGLPNKSHNRHPHRSTRVKRKSPGEIPLEDDIIMIDSPSDNPTSSRTSHDHRREIHSDKSTMDSNATEGAKRSGHALVDALEDVRRQMLQLISEGKQKKQLNQITAKSWQTKVYMECNIKHYNSTAEIFHYHARDLVQCLGPEWHDTQIYQWIKEHTSKQPTLTLISEAEAKQIVRRVKKTARGARIENADNENLQTEVSEYAGKRTPKNRPSGKAAGLRPSTGSKKRLRYETDFEDKMDIDKDGILKKKPKRSHYFTEEDDDDDEDDDNDGVGEYDEGSSSESKPHGEKDDVPMTQFVIRAEKLPPTQPQGPNKTWVCEEPDCGYIVRAAHEEKGRKLISAHYEEHEREAQDVAQETALDRENLAVQEGTRGHMPIKYAYIPPFLILITYEEAAVHTQLRGVLGT